MATRSFKALFAPKPETTTATLKGNKTMRTRSYLLAALVAGTTLATAAPAIAQPRDTPAPAPADPAPPPTPDGTAGGEASWSFATGSSVLFPVATWPELMRLTHYSERYLTLVIYGGWQPGAEESIEKVSTEDQRKRFVNLFTSLKEIFAIHGTTLPAELNTAFMGYLGKDGCVKGSDGEWTGCDALVQKVETETEKYLAAATQNTFTANASECFAYVRENFLGGDSIILFHGILGAITGELPMNQRPWKLGDGDGSGGSSISNKGFHLGADARYVHIFADDRITNGDAYTVGANAGWNFGQFDLNLGVGMLRVENGGITSHQSEVVDNGKMTEAYARFGADFRPHIGGNFHLRLGGDGTVISNGGWAIGAHLVPEYNVSKSVVIGAGVGTGYFQSNKAFGANRAIETIDPKLEGVKVEGILVISGYL